MLKEILVYCAVLIGFCAVSTFADTLVEGCKYEDELWGSEDGTKFYFCLPGLGYALEQTCPPETFFVRNETRYGCLANDFVNPACVNLEDPGECAGENLLQPQYSRTLTNYYLCPSEGSAPIELSCPTGQAFLNQDDYLGCFDWTTWRTVRNCPNQYS